MKSSLKVAARLLELAREQEKTLTPMQLIKLVYICHGWMLGAFGKPLVSDDAEAWQYGPVYPVLYNKVKKFRSSPVPAEEFEGYAAQPEEFNENELEVMDVIFGYYSQFDGVGLSNLTHKKGSPWDVTWSKLGKNSTISNDLIENHYSKMNKENAAKKSASAEANTADA